MALNALWPTIHATPAAPFDPLGVICTTAVRDTSDNGAVPPAGIPEGRHHASYCALCASGAHLAALPFSGAPLLLAVAGNDAPLSQRNTASLPWDVAYLSAAPRAPPALS